jgi:hypothetical protein
MSLLRKALQLMRSALGFPSTPLVFSVVGGTGFAMPGVIQVPLTDFVVADGQTFADELRARGLYLQPDWEQKFDDIIIAIRTKEADVARQELDILLQLPDLQQCASLRINSAVVSALLGNPGEAEQELMMASELLEVLPEISMMFGVLYECIEDNLAAIEA